MSAQTRSRFSSEASSEKIACGRFWISWNQEDLQISVTHDREPERILWQSLPGHSFIELATVNLGVKESRGFFQFKEKNHQAAQSYQLEAFEALEGAVQLRGEAKGSINTSWTLRFHSIDDEQLQFIVDAPALTNKASTKIYLVFAGNEKDKIFGFGEQFTHLDIQGRKMRVLSQEPGIGRGVQPLTWFMKTFFKAGGEWDSSNAPAPHYLTSSCRSMFLENSEYSIFDFTNKQRTKVAVYSNQLCGRILFGNNPFELIEVYTRYAGRMPSPPAWLQSGAIIGMQGGTQAVEDMHAKLQAHNTPIAAFWLQDWVGSRKTSVGKQLWWNWEIGRETYPNWEELVQKFRESEARVLSYINPFLVDPTDKGDFDRNLFQEAIDKKYVIARPSGEPYWILNTSFSAVLLDLTNPEARVWIKDVIKTQLIESGASGWMADFGEALPFDAVLYDGSDAAQYHNRYPVEWVKLNREAIQEAGKENEIAFFARSGYTQSPRYSTLFWLGDQLVGWRQEDGIKSTLIALLSSGFSGFSQNHSDIGGYTATTFPSLSIKIPGVGFTRSRELLWRWIELNAFTPVYRTHEGNQPTRNFQIDGDDDTLGHFARFARVYAALGEYRAVLSEQAAQSGAPLVRHPWMHFFEDEQVLGLELQFMLGPDFMVAPTLDPNQSEQRLYLPKGDWTHLWSKESIRLESGAYVHVQAPLGFPAIFYPANSTWGQKLHSDLSESNDLAWTQSSAIISPQ